MKITEILVTELPEQQKQCILGCFEQLEKHSACRNDTLCVGTYILCEVMSRLPIQQRAEFARAIGSALLLLEKSEQGPFGLYKTLVPLE